MPTTDPTDTPMRRLTNLLFIVAALALCNVIVWYVALYVIASKFH